MTKIVIVDHHAAFRQSLSLMLKEISGNTEITELNCSLKLIDHLDEFSPDLILMDRMQDKTGIQTAEKAIEKFPALRIILLTMFNENSYVEEAKNAGLKGLIPKPPTLNELREAYQIIMNGGFYFPHH